MRIVPSLDFVSSSLPRMSRHPAPEESIGKKFNDFVTMLQKVYRNLATAFNGNIGFGDGTNADNINGVWKNVVFPVANTDVTITHNLGRIPVGYIPMTKSQAGDVFNGTVAATKTQITLQCSTSGTTVNLFIV